MNYCLAQIILAARGDDVEGWMNTLVVVLIAVFWAIGGILKARARKAETKTEDEYEAEPLEPAAHPAAAKPVQRPQPPHRVFSLEDKRRVIRGDVRKVEQRRAKPSVTVRKAAVAKQARPRFAEAAQDREQPRKPVSAPEEEPTVALLLSAERPDELRRAILYYEILGKPLALREPI